jgi:hypothetical protein
MKFKEGEILFVVSRPQGCFFNKITGKGLPDVQNTAIALIKSQKEHNHAVKTTGLRN